MPAARGEPNVRSVFSVRIHGRGGQGVVTAAELLASAAFADGLEAQAFPSFGSERMGAPVIAFCRVDERVTGVSVTVRKLHPPVRAMVDHVAVCIEQ